MPLDQAQSARLGQRVAPESTFVQMFDVDPATPTADLVEAAWSGMLIFRTDTSGLQIYDGQVGAWIAIGGGTGGALTFVSPDEPTGGSYSVGDLWYDTDDGYKQYVWDGDTWNPVAAGSGTFYQPNPPSGANTGDQWIDSDDHQLYVWDGTIWQPTSTSVDRAYQQAAQELAYQCRVYFGGYMAHRTVFYSGASLPPASPVLEDVWCNTDTLDVQSFTAAGWQPVTSFDLREAVQAANIGRFTQDGEISIYAMTSPPVGLDGGNAGDIWHSVDDHYQAKIWSGVSWINLQVGTGGIADQTVGNDQISDGSIHAGEKVVAGTINTPLLADGAITNTKISDFAVAARQLATHTHTIY
jgi:hypothetical protein